MVLVSYLKRFMASDWIPLSKTDYGSLETDYIVAALNSQRLEGDGPYTKKVHSYFRVKYQFEHNFFTPSCTDALELMALLLNLQVGDEVIVPSYTFPSTAHAFSLRGAKIMFADSLPYHPNLDPNQLQNLITPKTKAVCLVYYGGAAHDLGLIQSICEKNGVTLVGDAAQAIDSFYDGIPLAAWGSLSALSFHQTKNISSGEGGLLVVNDSRFKGRAEIIREKGTNRSRFLRGEIDKYSCVDIGSSFVGSDLNAALLLAQLERLDELQKRRRQIWDLYASEFANLPVLLPKMDPKCQHNAHNYFFVFDSEEARNNYIDFMKSKQIGVSFHYVGLHLGDYYNKKENCPLPLPNSEMFSRCLVRLPIYASMTEAEIGRVLDATHEFF
jgi:dTDP-4-amino-4,6-dideoxygalactose transaminase